MTSEPGPAAPAAGAPHPAPPSPPELPAGVERQPRWPWWYGLAAFGAAFGVSIVVGMIVGLVALLLGSDADTGDTPPMVVIIVTIALDLVLVGAALMFANFKLRPRAWHFGLRRTRFWAALGWAALGLFSYYVLSGVYAALLELDAEQTVTEDLGVRESDLLLILGATLVIVVAPIAEEVFFRGFFYKALRTSLPIWAAALIDGAVFGAIHFAGSETLAILPTLALLGVIFCLVYERTGSLYPVIGMHAFNNTLAFGVQTGTDGAWIVGGALGLATVAACVAVPRFAWRAAPAAR